MNSSLNIELNKLKTQIDELVRQLELMEDRPEAKDCVNDLLFLRYLLSKVTELPAEEQTTKTKEAQLKVERIREKTAHMIGSGACTAAPPGAYHSELVETEAIAERLLRSKKGTADCEAGKDSTLNHAERQEGVDKSGEAATLGANPSEHTFRYHTRTASIVMQARPQEKGGRQFFTICGGFHEHNKQTELGKFQAVIIAKAFAAAELDNYPLPQEEPTEPFDEPSEYEWNPCMNPFKAKWSFADGSEILTVGNALSRWAILAGRAPQMWFSLAAFVSGGAGKFRHVKGQASCLGSIYFSTFPTPGEQYQIELLHAIKLIHT